MKLLQILKGLAVGLSAAGLLFPHSAVSAADQVRTGNQVRTSSYRSTETISDVALDSQGILHGQVLTASGLPSKNTEIRVQQGSQEVTRTTTDAQGNFHVVGLKGGVYTVSTPGEARVYRVWTHRAAPPSVTHGVLFVDGESIARGQMGVEAISLGVIALGAVAGTIIATTVDHNSAS